MDSELEYYNKVKNWDFSQIKCIEESLTNWNMYDILNKVATKDSYILDLGTGGGEMLLEYFPKAKEVPCVFNNWANFKDGKFISNTLLNKNSFEKLVK